MNLKNTTWLASAFAMAIAGATNAQAEKVKCYGVAKAGHNDCASVYNHHSCQGHATKDNDPHEYKLVESEEQCKAMGGTLTEGGMQDKIREQKY
jgi:uncharacterized membrane protein